MSVDWADQHFGAVRNVSFTVRMNWHDILYIDIHAPKRMNITDFGDLLMFPLAPPEGLHLWFWEEYQLLDENCNNFGDPSFFIHRIHQKEYFSPILWFMTKYQKS